MGQEYPGTTVSEDDLHAFVDGQLPVGQRSKVTAYLGEDPEATDRVAVYLHQRAELIMLGQHLNEALAANRLTELETMLCSALRRQRRVRGAVAAGGAVMLTAIVGWAGWLLGSGYRGRVDLSTAGRGVRA
jgi:anti-sigma factor RsiW